MYLAGTRLNHSAKATLLIYHFYDFNLTILKTMYKSSTGATPRPSKMEVNCAEVAGGADGEEVPGAAIPRDARIVKALLKSMGVEDYEPRVVHQFLELWYRYVVDVLSDAQIYSEHASKPSIDPDDVKLAIQTRINFSFSQPPPREVLLELARNRNKIPLPKSIEGPGGMPLPPEQDTLINPNYQLMIPRRQPQVTEPDEEEEGGDGAAGAAAGNSNPTPNPGASLPPEQQQKVSFPLTGVKRPR